MWADHMPDYLLATLTRMVQARRRNISTATVGDSAGQDMVDDMMAGARGESRSGGDGGGGRSGGGEGQRRWAGEGESEWGSTPPSESEAGGGG